MPDHVEEDVRNVLPEIRAEEQADSLDEEDVAIVMEIAEVIERGRKVPIKKLLEETAKVDKILNKFKIHKYYKD